MEWYTIKSEMESCTKRVGALVSLLSNMEQQAKDIQSQLSNKVQETFASDIYRAIQPIFDKKIKDIQAETIQRITGKE